VVAGTATAGTADHDDPVGTPADGTMGGSGDRGYGEGV